MAGKPQTSDVFYEQMSRAMREATKEAAALREEVVALRLDRDRLDFLIQASAEVHCRHGDPTDQEPIWTVQKADGKHVTRMANLREVIDIARGVPLPPIKRYSQEWHRNHLDYEQRRRALRKAEREAKQ